VRIFKNVIVGKKLELAIRKEGRKTTFTKIACDWQEPLDIAQEDIETTAARKRAGINPDRNRSDPDDHRLATGRCGGLYAVGRETMANAPWIPSKTKREKQIAKGQLSANRKRNRYLAEEWRRDQVDAPRRAQSTLDIDESNK